MPPLARTLRADHSSTTCQLLEPHAATTRTLRDDSSPTASSGPRPIAPLYPCRSSPLPIALAAHHPARTSCSYPTALAARHPSLLPIVPELPDVTIYAERLTECFGGQRLTRVRLGSPFLLRTTQPPLESYFGLRLLGAGRMGKRLVLGFEGGPVLVIHLMISGRLRRRPVGVPLPKKVGVAAFDFEQDALLFTEQSSQKRASLHAFTSHEAARVLDRGGVEPLRATTPEFAAALRRENRTIKRALCDPRLVAGIGNAYSDEILFTARMSPTTRTHSLDDEAIARLHDAARTTLREWTERLRAAVGSGFPEKVTAFHPEMAVHGRYKQPCRVCGTKVQRVAFATNELDYCPRCQTGGKLLRDRSLSLLLKNDFPSTIDELEEMESR